MEERNDKNILSRLKDKAEKTEIRGFAAVAFMVLLSIFFILAVILEIAKLVSRNPMLLLAGIGIGVVIFVVYYYRYLKE